MQFHFHESPSSFFSSPFAPQQSGDGMTTGNVLHLGKSLLEIGMFFTLYIMLQMLLSNVVYICKTAANVIHILYNLLLKCEVKTKDLFYFAVSSISSIL